ncbi:MAG: DUF2804 domain-containing protein [Polyangiaceae bacterium]|nr:DUF2804 domain-containing protein [Polyangiaceae bacterium]
MRTLLPPPASVIDPSTGTLNAGSFRGGLPRVDLSPLEPRPMRRFFSHKRWIYVAIASEQVYLGAAVVDLGYAANAFAFVYDRTEARMIADRAALGPPLLVEVSDVAGEGAHARARLPGARLRFERPRGETIMLVEIEIGDLRVFARMDCAGAPPAIGAIGRVAGGGADTTEKRALLAVTGEASVAGRRLSLDGALGGYDYTNGLLPRRTVWRWAFALGRARTGERVGLNLVEGMTGEAECALWIGRDLFPLAEGRFSFDPARPLDPWRVQTADGAVDLRFTPGGMHAERKNLGLVRSRFVQPAGLCSGLIRIPGGGELALDGALGVTEDQDVVW